MNLTAHFRKALEDVRARTLLKARGQPPFPGAVFDEQKHRWVNRDKDQPATDSRHNPDLDAVFNAPPVERPKPDESRMRDNPALDDVFGVGGQNPTPQTPPTNTTPQPTRTEKRQTVADAVKDHQAITPSKLPDLIEALTALSPSELAQIAALLRQRMAQPVAGRRAIPVARPIPIARPIPVARPIPIAKPLPVARRRAIPVARRVKSLAREDAAFAFLFAVEAIAEDAGQWRVLKAAVAELDDPIATMLEDVPDEVILKGEWHEEEHPRDHGEFSRKPGGGAKVKLRAGQIEPEMVKRTADGMPDVADPKSVAYVAAQLRRAMYRASGGESKDWCIATARALRSVYPSAEIWYGYFEGHEEQAHTIAKLGDYFIDVTADQFSGPKVVVRRDLDREYEDFQAENLPPSKYLATNEQKIATDLRGRLAKAFADSEWFLEDFADGIEVEGRKLGDTLRWVKAFEPDEYESLLADVCDEWELERITKADRSHLVRTVITNRLGHRQVVWKRPAEEDTHRGQSRGQASHEEPEKGGHVEMTQEQKHESRTIIAKAVENSNSLNPEQLKDLAKHVNAITKEEAKGLLRQLDQKVSGLQKDVARRLVDAIRAGREQGHGVGDALQRSGNKVTGQYGAWGQAAGGGGKPVSRDSLPKRGVGPGEKVEGEKPSEEVTPDVPATEAPSHTLTTDDGDTLTFTRPASRGLLAQMAKHKAAGKDTSAAEIALANAHGSDQDDAVGDTAHRQMLARRLSSAHRDAVRLGRHDAADVADSLLTGPHVGAVRIGTAGETVPFNPIHHESDDSLGKGQPVTVERHGHRIDEGDGREYVVGKAKVKAAKPVPESSDVGGFVGDITPDKKKAEIVRASRDRETNASDAGKISDARYKAVANDLVNAVGAHNAAVTVGPHVADLYSLVGRKHGLSPEEFRGALRRLHDDGRLQLSGRSKTLGEEPRPDLLVAAGGTERAWAHPGPKERGRQHEPKHIRDQVASAADPEKMKPAQNPTT